MPDVGRIVLAPKRALSTAKYDFDFTSGLKAGVTISSSVTTAAVYSGVDAAPSGIVGASSISGSVVTQTFTAGVAGVIYAVIVQATTSDTQVLRMMAFLTVLPDF